MDRSYNLAGKDSVGVLLILVYLLCQKWKKFWCKIKKTVGGCGCGCVKILLHLNNTEEELKLECIGGKNSTFSFFGQRREKLFIYI